LLFFGLVVLFAIVAPTGVLAADSPMPVPPMVHSQSVVTATESPVEIPLTASGRIVEPLQFLIRRPPSLGTLGAIRRTGRDSASVTYTPPPGRKGDFSDTFTFAVQSLDSAVSASATVRIQVAEPAPMLECAKEIDFGTVVPGDSVEMPLALRNSGGRILRGKVQVAPPWSVVGTSDFAIPAGAGATVQLRFSPTSEQKYEFVVRWPGDQFVVLRGSASLPIAWVPARLSADAAQRASGNMTLGLMNRSSTPQRVDFTWPDCVRAQASVDIPVGGSVSIPITLPGDRRESFEGTVALRSGTFHAQIPLTIPAAPARLVLVGGAMLDLGRIPQGRLATARFTIANMGGPASPLQAGVPEGMGVTPPFSETPIPAGSNQTFQIQIEPTKAGHYSERVELASPPAPPLAIEVVADVVAADAPSAVIPAPATDSPPSVPMASASPASGVPSGTLLHLPETPSTDDAPSGPPGTAKPVSDARVSRSARHEADVTWTAERPSANDYLVERRTIGPSPDGGVRISWVHWPEVRISVRDGIATAKFLRLYAGTFWTVRIVALDAEGKRSEPSAPLRIQTQDPFKFGVPWWVLVSVLFALIIWVGKLRQRSHSEQDYQLSRIFDRK